MSSTKLFGFIQSKISIQKYEHVNINSDDDKLVNFSENQSKS